MTMPYTDVWRNIEFILFNIIKSKMNILLVILFMMYWFSCDGYASVVFLVIGLWMLYTADSCNPLLPRCAAL